MARLRILWVGALTIAAGTLNAPVAAYSQQDVWRLDSSESITYFIAEGSAELGFKEGDRALVLAAGENFPFVADEKVTARRPRTGRGG